MGTVKFLYLPEEIILQIVQHVRWRYIQSLRLASKKLAHIARHRLHSRLYLSSHGPDIKLFQKVVADQELSQGVTEVVFDDTTFPFTLTTRRWFDARTSLRCHLPLQAIHFEDFDPYQSTAEAYRLWSEFVQEHQRNRFAALNQEQLTTHLSSFQRLERINTTNINGNDIPIASMPHSLPTVQQ